MLGLVVFTGSDGVSSSGFIMSLGGSMNGVQLGQPGFLGVSLLLESGSNLSFPFSLSFLFLDFNSEGFSSGYSELVGCNFGQTSFLSGFSCLHSSVIVGYPLVMTGRMVADVDIGSVLSPGDGAV